MVRTIPRLRYSLGSAPKGTSPCSRLSSSGKLQWLVMLCIIDWLGRKGGSSSSTLVKPRHTLCSWGGPSHWFWPSPRDWPPWNLSTWIDQKKKKKLQFCTSSSFLLLLGWKWCSFPLSTSQTEAGSQIWGYQVYLKLYSFYFLFLWG